MKKMLATLIISLIVVFIFGILPTNADTIDFGDAPDNYPTLLASNGARHEISDLFLGYSVDDELDGQSNFTATGDDVGGSDDDDGILFTSDAVLGKDVNIDVRSSGSGYLKAWVDFNQDGDWMDADELVFSDQSLVAGTQTLIFFIPSSAALGNTYARFRLTPTESANFDGLISGGEVEDYMITIVDSIPPAPVPEPTTIILFSIGLLGVAGVNRRKNTITI